MGGYFSKNFQDKIGMKKKSSSSKRQINCQTFLVKNKISRNETKNENEGIKKFCQDIENEDVDRTHLIHFYFGVVWNSNFKSPIEKILQNGALILDVGCGPGTFCTDLATTYTRSNFVGLDWNPIFPTHIKPPNVSFYKHNLFEGIPFAEKKFDFIHIRFMKHCFNEIDWEQKIMPELFRVLKPGGWIEFMEFNKYIYNIGTTTSLVLEKFLEKNNFNYFHISRQKFQDIIQIYESQLASITIEEKINTWYPVQSLSTFDLGMLTALC
ncbi:4856_t:CDS:2 [Diversispora eburnea]|uniref:4856_t:CDS:1 n=2 Tax=Diversisporales TaxID=214509 RepID=A0A9N9AG29_9GLOM|nr:4856_t:CDS:2 [Diversispora eburnea]CAG8642823.1 2951_t:CDS:2 [Dentiscutata erythropus]